jgi:uncharacterized iron-regulated membrane protein
MKAQSRLLRLALTFLLCFTLLPGIPWPAFAEEGVSKAEEAAEASEPQQLPAETEASAEELADEDLLPETASDIPEPDSQTARQPGAFEAGKRKEMRVIGQKSD